MRKGTVVTSSKYNDRAYVMNNMLSVGGFDLTSKDLMNVGRRYPTHFEFKHSFAQACNHSFVGVNTKFVGCAKDVCVDYKKRIVDGTERVVIVPTDDSPYKIRVKNVKYERKNGEVKICRDYSVSCPRGLMDEFVPIPEGGHCCHFGLQAIKGKKGFVIIPIELPEK